jgi:hypothetical protein
VQVERRGREDFVEPITLGVGWMRNEQPVPADEIDDLCGQIRRRK